MSGGPWSFPADHWLPENINDHGGIIDSLFMFILYLTGIIFIGTSVAMFWFMWKYDADKTAEPVKFTHGSHSLEIVWSILPAATLLFIAIYQMNAWADAKLNRPTIAGSDEPQPPLVEVTGRQFEWRMRYAGEDGVIGTLDDIHTVNDLHVPVNERSRDRHQEPRCAAQFLSAQLADQARFGARHEAIRLVPGQSDGHFRHRLRGAMRLGALQDARAADRRFAGTLQRLAGRDLR